HRPRHRQLHPDRRLAGRSVARRCAAEAAGLSGLYRRRGPGAHPGGHGRAPRPCRAPAGTAAAAGAAAGLHGLRPGGHAA
nr:hypothetical protein [Tanacetum cinerariifolium]